MMRSPQRVTTLETARHVDDVHDQGGALDVAQELVTQALALARALDKAGDVGNDEEYSPARTMPRLGTSVVNG